MASYVLEMWYRWHQYLWSHCSVPFKNEASADGDDNPQSNLLIHPVITSTIVNILQGTSAINDYFVYRSKLKAASRSLWTSSREKDLSSCLFPAACSLFKQIIYAHKKSFDADKFAAIKSTLCSLEKEMIKENSIQRLSSLIASSNHQQLKSLVNKHIEPLLEELCPQPSSTDIHYNLGRAWLRIGGLRFQLLLSCDDKDPTKKYFLKCSQLEEKISKLELEIEVRQECNHLAGCFATSKADKKRADQLESLKLEHRKVQRKIVFRSDPKKFKKLKYECKKYFDDYFEKFLGLVMNISSMDLQQIVSKVRNWQEDAISFVERLLDEYPAYDDIVQPVQVAMYEMKLGLSLVLSSALQNSFLRRVEEDNIDRVMETIHEFIRYPRGCAFEPSSVNHETLLSNHPTKGWALDFNLLEKLVAVSSEASADKALQISESHAKAALHQNILLRVALSVANARIMDKASYMLLDKIFNDFTNLWMNMKVQTKTKEDYDAQQFKFRPRAFTIDSVVEVDISSLGKLFTNDSFSEWKESEEDLTERMEGDERLESLEDEWSLMEETVLNNMVYIHNQLFGSVNLVLAPGKFHVSDVDRLLSFGDSYSLGVGMIKGLGGLSSSSLDAKLVPEHLLRLCLEHKGVFVSSSDSAHKNNFYKDSNAPSMSKMVELLTSLKWRVISLLTEWEDHAGLQKILDVVEMLLVIPLNTPLAKALSGLQFLLNRIWALQESGSKFALAELENIIALASSWQKMEFDSWPALLDAVQDQYEKNAGKLWFPLYSVLHRDSADAAEYNQSTIQSLEEFIQTSSLGEFRKRLQLLLAFHGQINAGKCLKICSSNSKMENLMIIYNVFGFYVQFLPLVMEHMETNRKNIETELKQLLKLCRWDRMENNLSFENSKRTRQKLKKLIKKYTDLLQQPVMLILNKEAAQYAAKAQSSQGPTPLSSFSDKNEEILNSALRLTQLKDEDRFMWLSKWTEKVNQALQDLHPGGTSDIDNSYSDIPSIIPQSSTFESACHLYQEEWTVVWHTLENICETTSGCSDRWKVIGKRIGKRRDLDELLKLLESSGLRRHGFMPVQDQLNSNQLSLRFLGPSYDVHHLLPEGRRLTRGTSDIVDSSEVQSADWKTVNEYYFKSMASVLVLQQICLKFHKDFSLEQVNRSASFLDHLIAIQQEHRAAAYSFTEHLKRLQKCTSALGSLCSSSSQSSNAQNGHAVKKFMWEQKLIFDSLYDISNEELLLLRTVESTHLNDCQSVKAAANKVLDFITEFNHVFRESKESLDNYFVGRDGAITTMAGSLYPHVVSVQEEQMVAQNFLVIKTFHERLSDFRQDFDGNSVEEALLHHFDNVIEKGKLLENQFNSSTVLGNVSKDTCQDISIYNNKNSDPKADCGGALKRIWSNTMDILQKLSSLNNGDASSESLGKVTSSKSLFEAYAANLNVDLLCDDLETIFHAQNHSGHGAPGLSSHTQGQLKHLHVLLDLLLDFGNNLLQDFLTVHKTVSIMTHILAKVFASLYSQGFGASTEDQEDDTGGDVPQDSSGTGMGEGAGKNDVSDQIDDEDQLLGTSEKDGEEQDASDKVPDNNNKGIEMEQDFEADAVSISEDSGENNDEDGGDEDDQLESAMGENGAESEVIDEKLWDKEDEENPNETKEKYEAGSSVKDTDTSSRELRAKEDGATTADEPEELNLDEADKNNDQIGSEDDPADKENGEDMKMNKDEAFTDPTGLKPEELNHNSEEDTDMNEDEGLGSMEDPDPNELDESNENEDHDGEKTGPVDETMEEAEAQQMDDDTEGAEPGKDDGEANAETSEMDTKKEGSEPGSSDFTSEHVPNTDSATQPRGDSQVPCSRNVAPEANWSGGNDVHNDVAPTRGLPSDSASEMDSMMADASNGGRFADDQQKTQLPQNELSSVQNNEPNANRNAGNALEQWKERVMVSVDLQAENIKRQDEIEDEDADEYGYVPEDEKGTAQALGPATSEQVDKNANGYKPDGENLAENGKGRDDMEVEKVNPESRHIDSSLNPKSKIEDQMRTNDVENSLREGSPEVHRQDACEPKNLSESLVSVKRSYFSEDTRHLLSIGDDEMGKAQDIEEVSADVKNDAAANWRRYELRTTRLSQELAEQLRLVLEPTLASKLQGDYRTGKRINMKKVISYIASHYRKDKIWLRRTRPNKRDYQVVIAVDDSRSMSENCCGDVAVEALVTVCRAMSQLEMGNLAVASFGKKGNIRLLHDFDQPFTGEAGVKMISSLTFQQENTIRDEPVVDLLKYLNNLLDTSVARARLPSGQNPLQQLVLIIADGRFTEKENLKRCVREALSAKRMVAFLLLDNSEESIYNLMEATFEGGDISFTKYLDSFPFPFYIILKNIEALPRTLADLLRQWFELMQNSRD